MQNGFKKAFPTVDSLCVSLGNNAMYYQGRIIENIRANNTTDGYVVNGWESTKIENHSGVVDVWRNPKGNTNILAYYNQPLYIAVKARNKVLETGKETIVDFFIINEKNIVGKALLEVKATDKNGLIFSKEFVVTVTGGSLYGELLKENISIPISSEGYTTINAVLIQNSKVITNGLESIFAVSLPIANIKQPILVSDSSGNIQKMLTQTDIAFTNLKSEFSSEINGLLVIDGNNKKFLRDTWHDRNELLEWVGNGNTVICLTNTDLFCEFLERKEIVDYYGKQDIGKVWYGGNYFNRTHTFFNGLPQNTAFNWEYQSLADYSKKRYGLRLKGEQAIAGVYADHRQEVYTALAIVPYGRGKIVLSTFDLVKAIKMTNNASNVVAKRLLINLLSK